MARAVVLGSGMVGSVIAADLVVSGFEVCVVDRSPASLARLENWCPGATTAEIDLAADGAIESAVDGADVAIGALSSVVGLAALERVARTGTPYCDICFMAEDALSLNDVARAHGSTAVVDCGVAPGMSNLLAAHGVALLDRADSIEIYVGGLPVDRRWPFEYKAAFSPYDVIEEYTRPSRLVEHGRVVTRPALSEPERLEFDGVGTLEAFNTDGLRSLIDTLDVPFMKEKTLRYPGHIALMEAFRETGFFSHDPVQVGDVVVRPIDLTSTLMFPKWTYEPGEADLTVMRIIVSGEKDGAPCTHTWHLHDRLDPATGMTSMARTTGFPCSIVAQLLADGSFVRPGVLAPEHLADDAARVEQIIAALATRGVHFVHEVSA